MKFNQSDCGPVDALLTWGGDHFLDNKLDPVDSVDTATKATMDALDSLLLTGSPPSSNFAELKPLPPFSTYTGNITVNGLGNGGGANHYQPAPSPQSTMGVPSSTSGRHPSIEGNNNNPNLYKTCMPTQSNGTVYYSSPEQVSSSADGVVSGNVLMKAEPVDYILGAPDIEDIAAIIGNAIADTTVPNVTVEGLDPADTRDSWMDLDAWIDTACSTDAKSETLDINAQFVSPSPPINVNVASSTLQTLLTQGPSHTYNNQQQQPQQSHQQQQIIKRDYHMPLLQSRLQNGGNLNGLKTTEVYTLKADPTYGIKIEPPYSPPCVINKDILPHTTHTSPPGHVSTTENPGVLNGRFQRKQPSYIRASGGMKDINGSLEGFPKMKPKSRSGKSNKLGGAYADGTKEKPVHRCTICNRGFLNKSNIKVHLRTHTGEKPFRCETCGKAFRQKAHLIKHQQIHKRVGRD